MSLLKRECLLPKIDGNISFAVGLFIAIFLSLILCVQLETYIFELQSDSLEDALCASNLAAAVIDVEELSLNNKVIISDFDTAYNLYLEAVKENLNLDETMVGNNSFSIAGIVTIEKFAIYNVVDEMVYFQVKNEDGNISAGEIIKANAYAPNGRKITNTGVYSEISFPVKGPFGLNAMAKKNKLVDVVYVKADEG